MTSEIELLKFIWKHGRKSSVRLLAGSSSFGIDYTRYILGGLLSKKMITPLRGRRDWFSLTKRGRKTLAKFGYIEPQTSRVKSVKKQKVRSISYDKPKKIVTTPIVITPKEQTKIVLTHNLDSQVEEQKLKLGMFVEKAAKSLRGILSAFEGGRR